MTFAYIRCSGSKAYPIPLPCVDWQMFGSHAMHVPSIPCQTPVHALSDCDVSPICDQAPLPREEDTQISLHDP